jgi:hypothetical protein
MKNHSTVPTCKLRVVRGKRGVVLRLEIALDVQAAVKIAARILKLMR